MSPQPLSESFGPSASETFDFKGTYGLGVSASRDRVVFIPENEMVRVIDSKVPVVPGPGARQIPVQFTGKKGPVNIPVQDVSAPVVS